MLINIRNDYYFKTIFLSIFYLIIIIQKSNCHQNNETAICYSCIYNSTARIQDCSIIICDFINTTCCFAAESSTCCKYLITTTKEIATTTIATTTITTTTITATTLASLTLNGTQNDSSIQIWLPILIVLVILFLVGILFVLGFIYSKRFNSFVKEFPNKLSSKSKANATVNSKPVQNLALTNLNNPISVSDVNYTDEDGYIMSSNDKITLDNNDPTKPTIVHPPNNVLYI